MSMHRANRARPGADEMPRSMCGGLALPPRQAPPLTRSDFVLPPKPDNRTADSRIKVVAGIAGAAGAAVAVGVIGRAVAGRGSS